MNDELAPLLATRRNDDGTYSVVDARLGGRLIKAGFKSHNEAKQWCDDRALQHLRHKRSKAENWRA